LGGRNVFTQRPQIEAFLFRLRDDAVFLAVLIEKLGKFFIERGIGNGVGQFEQGVAAEVGEEEQAVGLQGEGKEGSACIDGQHGAGKIGLHGGFAGCLVGRHYSILPPPFFFQTASPSDSHPSRPLYTEPFWVSCLPFPNPADEGGAYRAAGAARLQYGRKGRLNVQTASTEQAI